MSFRTKRVLFGTPFYMIFQFFLLKYLFSLFEGINEIYLICIVIFLGLLQVVPMFFEEKKSSKFGRFLSTVFGVWEWFLVMILIDEILIFITGIFIEIPKYIILLSLVVILLIGVYAYYNAHKIFIKEKTLKFDNLNRNYTIAHLSDVHFGSIRHRQIIEDIVNKLSSVEDKCDLIIISGDLADGSCAVDEDAFISFKKIKKPIIFTSGNHDYYPGLENVHNACKKAGIIVLENELFEFEDLNIYGLSYSFDDIPMPSEKELRDCIDSNKINIVNYHIPNGWNKLSDLGFDLQLSGHTHGGQFYPVIFFGNMMYEGHNMGLFNEKSDNNKNRYLHVTTGVGSMDIPMRWGTKSEIVLLKLNNE